jgi:sulfite exporter TauE/SafE/copper chaperone CopZ
MTDNKIFSFQVKGLSCKSCVCFVTEKISQIKEVKEVNVSLHKNELVVSGDFGESSEEEVRGLLNEKIKAKGYELFTAGTLPSANKKEEFKIAIPVALGFISLFILLQKIGIVNLLNVSKVTYGTAFAVGLIASVSTCMAVVGGLLLSISATYAKEGQKAGPQILFHIGRIVSFFLLGGAIGALGSTFQLGTHGTLIIGAIVALVMLIMGINLLDVFHFTKKLQPAMPGFVSKRALSISKFNHSLTPLVAGIATFFLPCGFTQSMQIYTLSTGNFLSGGLTMLSFALGTLPVLALISFGSFSIQNSPKRGYLFKSAGLVIIAFALFNLTNSLALARTPQNKNYQEKNYTPVNAETLSLNNVTVENGVQIVKIEAKGGFSPKKSIAKADIPTILRFTTNGTFDCSSSVRIPSLNISKSLPLSGQTDIKIPAQKAGTLSGTCGMGMYRFEVEFRN